MTDVAFDVLPVGILTGFLGSGKTTLLRRWLQGSAAGDTAVLINEFGDVGLDHLLVGAIDTDTVLLDNGCICCSVRGELKEALIRLFSRRQRGELPPFRRVVIETTGLATPGPVLATLLGDAQLRHHFRPAFVSTVVDAVHAGQQQALHPEWTAQVAAADTLWFSKTDLVTADQAKALRDTLQALNPLARQLEAPTGPAPWHGDLAHEASDDTARWIARVSAGTMRAPPGQKLAPARLGGDHAQHLERTHAISFCMVFERPIEWFTLTVWLTLLVHRHGDRLLRIKGLLGIAADGFAHGQPTVLHGIGHLMHPPEHLEAWPDEDRRSRLVFITQGLSEEAVTASWRAFERFYAPADLPAGVFPS
ncbi:MULTISPECIES: CobW family GTP-binding protein [unclassified Variovorax]|uniref:CobW family GTP-binding protein n=1 Tax=unclassified Variovorax TaxID=663243 RepID=UPI003F44F1F9